MCGNPEKLGFSQSRATDIFRIAKQHYLWLMTNYTAWWQRYMGVNNLPTVSTWLCITLRPRRPKSQNWYLSYLLVCNQPATQGQLSLLPLRGR